MVSNSIFNWFVASVCMCLSIQESSVCFSLYVIDDSVYIYISSNGWYSSIDHPLLVITFFNCLLFVCEFIVDAAGSVWLIISLFMRCKSIQYNATYSGSATGNLRTCKFKMKYALVFRSLKVDWKALELIFSGSSGRYIKWRAQIVTFWLFFSWSG